MKRHLVILLLLAVGAAASCTSFRAYEAGQESEKLQDFDRAVVEYKKALAVDPENVRYKIALQRASLAASRVHFEKGKELRAAGHHELAAIEFQLVTQLDPTNQFAAVELAKAVTAAREARLRAEGRTSLQEMKRRASITKAQPPQLNPASNEPISLSFPRETPVKDIYRALGNSFGINILFDQAIKDEKISIELRDVTAQQALERVMQAANHFYKVLDERTIIVVPDTPQTRRDYEDLVIRTFYLSNGEAEQVANVVRTMIEARNVFPLKALNAITIRDTADKVRIAEKIIESNDKAQAEVVVDVELLQLDIVRARELGAQLTTTNIAQTLVNAAGGAITGGTMDLIQDPSNEFSFTIPSVTYSFLKSNSDAQLLAKPQLRISEGQTASLHIGQRVPVPVTTFNTGQTVGGNIVPITSFQYQDVGIKISLEPRVHHNREVTLKLTVEVSNIAGRVSGGSGSPEQPIIGTRTIQSVIRLQDGETNFLAGLIRKDDAVSRNGIPFLSDLPVIGRLFERERNDLQNTDLVLTMTPHIIRIPDITDDDMAPMWVGTSGNLTFRGVSPRLESQTTGDPFGGAAGAADAAQFDNTGATPEFAVPGEQPAPADDAIDVIPPGTAPADPFLERRRVPPPPPPPDTTVNPEPQAMKSSGSLMSQDGSQYALDMVPRIAPQPVTLAMTPGQEALWTIVGMDLEGLSVEGLTLRYDPRTIDVVDVAIGTAIAIDPALPPAATIDRTTGTIRIMPTTGSSLTFRSGGEIALIRVRGALTGETFLVLDRPVLRNSAGAVIEAAVAGGRARVD